MHEDGKKLLDLMFLPDETVSVTNSKLTYHSIPLANAKNGRVTLFLPPNGNKTIEELTSHCDSDELLLCALNPISGFGTDKNVTKYRNFLIELDVLSTKEQVGYIKHSKMPYSAMIFSGSKSVHVLISLSTDLDSEKTYRFISSWILNIMTLADENIKNPSRKIRIPGAQRSPGKFQELLEFKGKITPKELADWLACHQMARPKARKKETPSKEKDGSRIKPWIAALMKRAKSGFPAGMGRNQAWFVIACECYLAGFNEDSTVDFLAQYFEEDHDFKEKEWLTSINSAFKYMSEK